MNVASRRRYRMLLWLAAGVAANTALPRALARAARGAAGRDEQDCHEPHHTPLHG